MRKYLLPENGTFYKANLHCHSTVSDGHWTPEEIKKRYMEKGYSVVAYTDHHIFYPHNELCDESFVALNGVEFGVNNIVDGVPANKFRKNCDICMIALSPDIRFQPCWNKEQNVPASWSAESAPLPDKYKQVALFDKARSSFKMNYTPEVINSMIDEGRKCGFFVTHNHPTWSREEYGDYIRYEGMHAMEICNYGSACSGFDEHNSKIYDEQLRAGKRLYCIATDDNHNRPKKPDSFGGFTMIKAEKLTYEGITTSLLKGNFYASEGPLIEELYLEDGQVHIATSPAQAIFITKPGKNVAIRKEEGKLISGACFDVEADDIYFFITVVGKNGEKAYTNAYFTEDLF
ncbi:MAG: PHP domain-containing protein [Oscillospiraceae bacterium]|nr:PHP domain-containing protein [Oscillospiraceae bacterium]MBQ7054555.1 PHP domain-containing protein [Oscillospiraceae bacterium]